MKAKIFLVVLIVAAAWVAGRHLSFAHDAARMDVKQEINQSFELASGAQVEVSGINGPVDIETTDGNVAEVHISATSNGDDLADTHIAVEHTPESLTIHGVRQRGWRLWSWLGGGGEVRQSVVLKLPRQIELAANGINGHIRVGDVEGAVRVHGINGKVEVGQATGYAEVSGVNGGVSIGVSNHGEQGMRVSGINGGVELKVGEGVNAELSINGLNGRASYDAPNVTVEEQSAHSSHARIGTGGAAINVSGINGSVHVMRS